MKKIVLIGYGGTIAMVPNESGALAPAKTIEDLVKYVPQLKSMADIELLQLENLDSTNVNPSHWMELGDKIQSLYSTCDAVVVTHGTDTMAYTASALALSLGDKIQIPVILTGSQLPMAEVGNDARFNLENAMKTAVEAVENNIAEVMVVFSDKVLRGSRTIKTSEARFDAFDTPAFPLLAQITATGVNFNPLTEKRIVEDSDTSFINGFRRGIFVVDLVPGLDPVLLRTLTESDKCGAVLLRSLGAGNVPSEGEYSILPVIAEALKNGKPILISTKFIGGIAIPELYEPGKLALDAGAIPTGDMTDVMAQVKLMWLMAQGYKSMGSLKDSMLRSVAGEVS